MPAGWLTMSSDAARQVAHMLGEAYERTIAPFALDYQGAGAPLRAMVNDTVAGLVVVPLALLGLVGRARQP